MNRAEQMELDTQSSLNLSLRDVYIFLRHPATVISAPRPSCLESRRVRVTLALRAMLPDDEVIIEGVVTRRTSRDCSVVFVIGSHRYSTVEQATAAIMEANA